MTYEFEYLMHLFSCGSRGVIPQPPRRPLNYERLIQLAQEHSVLPLVGAALSKTAGIGFPIEKRQAPLSTTRVMAFSNYIRRRQVLNLLHSFEKAGIQAMLLKGYAVADLYAEPDCRISSDTDIYVERKNEKRAYKLLKEHGCKVTPRSPISHHAICEHPQMGYIELHVLLYDETTGDIWFKKTDGQKLLQETYEKHYSPEGSYLTLGKTDNLIFLVLHMVKHFIHSGISLRQMMDIALYLKTYRFQIDSERFWSTLESLRYKKLVNTVLSALVSFGSFSPDDFAGYERVDDVAVSALVHDLEIGGWLGGNETEERKAARYRYNRSRYMKNRNTFIFWCHMLRRTFFRCFYAAIPSRTTLEANFPYAQKTTWLIPIAWIQHMFSCVLRLLLGKFDAGIASRMEQSSENKETRVQLFKLLQMM